MEAKELRIGNIVYYNGSHKEVGVVSEIHKNDLTEVSPYKIGINHRLDIYCNIHTLSPIPLTEEWLLKFGFEIRHFNNDPEKPLWWKVEKNRHIDIYPHSEHKFYFLINSMQMSTPIKYVHQLQNLYFALTREELTDKE